MRGRGLRLTIALVLALVGAALLATDLWFNRLPQQPTSEAAP